MKKIRKPNAEKMSDSELVEELNTENPDTPAMEELARRLEDGEFEGKISIPTVGASRGGIRYAEELEPEPVTTRSFTGSGVSVTSGSTTPSWVSPPFAPTTTGPFTTSSPVSPSTWEPLRTKKVRRKLVRFPSRFTSKVLLAFLDPDSPEEKNIVWAANLMPENIELVSDSDGSARLHITLSLEDVYDNLGENENEGNDSSS